MWMSPASTSPWWSACWATKMPHGRCCSAYCCTAPISRSHAASFGRSSRVRRPAPLREGGQQNQTFMGPYNLAGATLREHLFNLLNGVDQEDSSLQNALVDSA